MAPGASTAEALVELRNELEALRVEGEALAAALTEGPVAAGAAEPPRALDRRAAAVADRFWAMSLRVPSGLDPLVRNAVTTAVFAVGRLNAPYLRTDGWRTDEWTTMWRATVDDGRASAPRALAALDAAIRSRPRRLAVDPESIEAAESVVLLQLLARRGFGSGEFSTPPRADLVFVGALPAVTARRAVPDCATTWTGGPAVVGEFEPGRGGCAVLVVGTDDGSGRSRDIAAFVADPFARISGPRLDLATIRRVSGGWVGTLATPPATTS